MDYRGHRKRPAPSSGFTKTEEEKKEKEIKDRYRKLCQTVQQNTEKIRSDPKFQERIIKELKEIYPLWKVEGDTRNACINSLMDARIIRKTMAVLRQDAEEGATHFNVEEFGNNLVTRGMGATFDDNGEFSLTTNNWIKFGRSQSRFFKQVPSLNYLFGSLDKVRSLSQSSTESVKQRRQKTPKPVPDEVFPTRFKTMNIRDIEDKDVSIEEAVEKVLWMLKRKYDRTGESLSLLEFTLDPNSYTDTIRNIFYVSFLVKERRVVLQIQDGIPYIQPKSLVSVMNGQNPASKKSSESDQMIFSIDHEQYKQLIEALEIKEAMIILK